MGGKDMVKKFTFNEDELRFWKEKCKDLDELDLKIYLTLRENGRISDTEIAKRVGSSVSTVRRRRIDLEKKGILKVIGLLIYQKSKLAYADVLIKFKCSQMLTKKDEFFKKAMASYNVFEIALYLSSEYDMLLRIVDKDPDELRKTITKFIGKYSPIIEKYLILPVTKSPKAFDVKLENNINTISKD